MNQNRGDRAASFAAAFLAIVAQQHGERRGARMGHETGLSFSLRHHNVSRALRTALPLVTALDAVQDGGLVEQTLKAKK
jgi:hypothetical protein